MSGNDRVDGTSGAGAGEGDADWWEEPTEIDRTIPHMARMYDYLLGGRANFAADRRLVEHAAAALPGGIEQARMNARVNREFLACSVSRLAGELGIRQFLDIGSGLPTEQNLHQVAQAEDPTCRVVYVDHDPIVLAHGRMLLRGTPEGATAYLDADLREPDQILHEAAATLDFTEPVAVMLLAVLHYVLDDEGPYGIVARLMGAVPPGSYLVVSHLASDVDPEAMAELVRRHNEGAPADLAVVRSRAEVARFFDGLEVLEPGVVPIDDWLRRSSPTPVGVPRPRATASGGSGRPAPFPGACGGPAPSAATPRRPVPLHGGIARKP